MTKIPQNHQILLLITSKNDQNTIEMSKLTKKIFKNSKITLKLWKMFRNIKLAKYPIKPLK